MEKCKACKSTEVIELQSSEVIKYKDKDLTIAIDYSTCGNCQREFVSKNQILSNDARIRAAKKEFDGLMSSQDLKRARKSLGLTQEAAALLFGGGINAFSKYERGEVTQSTALDLLIKACLKWEEVFQYVMDESGTPSTGFVSKLTRTQSVFWRLTPTSVGSSDSDTGYMVSSNAKKASPSWNQQVVDLAQSNNLPSSGYGETINVH